MKTFNAECKTNAEKIIFHTIKALKIFLKYFEGSFLKRNSPLKNLPFVSVLVKVSSCCSVSITSFSQVGRQNLLEEYQSQHTYFVKRQIAHFTKGKKRKEMHASGTYRCYISLQRKTQVFWAGSKSNSLLLHEPMKTAQISCVCSFTAMILATDRKTEV